MIARDLLPSGRPGPLALAGFLALVALAPPVKMLPVQDFNFSGIHPMLT